MERQFATWQIGDYEHELEAGDLKMLSDYKSDKSVGKALEEIAAGDVIIDPKSKMLERDAEKLDHKD